ncbi:MAG: hypothetical protein KDC92_01340 [Bacteroidetes bacterium]|nr:hypothetical protein [Bacteroidota bacterium]
MILRVIFILGLLLANLVGNAQVLLSPRVDYENSTLLGNDINQFFDSYNSYYANSTTTFFEPISPGDFSHTNYGGAIRLNLGDPLAIFSGFSFTYGKGMATRQAIHANGLKAQTDFNIFDYVGQYDLGLRYKIFVASAHMSGRYRKTRMNFGYFYQDGTYSIGNEYDILGVYEASTITLDYGFTVGIKWERFYFPVSWSYASNAFSDDGLLTLVDFEKRQIRWQDLPRDYGQWVADPAGLDPNSQLVRANSFRSNRINIGVEISLFKDSTDDNK